MKRYSVLIGLSLLLGCSSVAIEEGEESSVENRSSISDSDHDYIADNIERYLGLNPYDSDENDNGILDGLESDGSFGDKFFNKQWYIRSTGTVTNGSGVSSIYGNDLNLLPIYQNFMGYNSGNNIIIQVVDGGVYGHHEDLIDNIDLSRSYNGNSVGSISKPSASDTHGTKVAGVIGARAFNGKGVRGIIPFAKIAVSNWLSYSSYTLLGKAWYSGSGANDIAISNNSWGFGFSNDIVPEAYMEKGSSSLRSGKGRLYVFPSGNSRTTRGNSNLQYLLNNRFAITVASVNHDNKYSSFSTQGSNILVSAYSGENKLTSPTIATTTVPHGSTNTGSNITTWSNDYTRSYTYDFDGTSTAAPMVSASLGLVLEACPSLNWRDVRYLLALSSKRIDTSNSSWIKNAAGIYHSTDYGYGLINPSKMIELCRGDYENLAVETSFQKTIYPQQKIADNLSTTTLNLSVQRSITLEWIEFTLNSDHSYASDLEVYLISPSGTKTQIMSQNNISASPSSYGTSSDWMNGGFRLSSAAFVDEKSSGEWRVEINDKSMGDSGYIKSVTLKMYGHS